MIKMGKTKYNVAGKAIKPFFYRFDRKSEWKALLSTGTTLTPYKAYQIYSMRWSIEVTFHECKSLLKLGKCQCRDFGSQIASISLNILQYNLLSYVKRFESYETIGGLFREITAQTVELSVTEKIWGLIQQLVSAIADSLISGDPALCMLVGWQDAPSRSIPAMRSEGRVVIFISIWSFSDLIGFGV